MRPGFVFLAGKCTPSISIHQLLICFPADEIRAHMSSISTGHLQGCNRAFFPRSQHQQNMLFYSEIYSHDSVAAHTVTVTGRQRQEPKDWHGAACLFSASQVCMDLACTGTVLNGSSSIYAKAVRHSSTINRPHQFFTIHYLTLERERERDWSSHQMWQFNNVGKKARKRYATPS